MVVNPVNLRAIPASSARYTCGYIEAGIVTPGHLGTGAARAAAVSEQQQQRREPMRQQQQQHQQQERATAGKINSVTAVSEQQQRVSSSK